MDTNQDTKLPATYVATSASIPGAVQADVSSVQGQRAFQKTTLSDGPMYYPEDDEKLALCVEQESVSSKRASGQSHNDKTKKIDAMAVTDKTLKRPATRSDRQENRNARVVARTLRENPQPPDVSLTQNTDQDNEDEDVENATPGAVRVAGRNFTSRHGAGDEEDQDLAVATAIEDDEDDNKFLATALEYHPDARPPIYKNRRFQMYMGVGCCILLVTIVIAIVGTTVLGNDGGRVIRETNEPTSAPTMSPTTSEVGRYTVFFAEQVSELVYSPDTSHSLALQWIMNEDPLQLDIDSARILQRYLMAFFYYSTSNNTLSPWRSCAPAVEGEDDSCVFLEFTLSPLNESVVYVEQPGKKRWLSGTHECEWEGIVCLGGDDVLGIEICE
jgi:hypothetical protein